MDNILTARIRDAEKRCLSSDIPAYLGFLSPEEAALANEALKYSPVEYRFCGGYEGAERVYLACIPSRCEAPEPPIEAVTFLYSEAYPLSHRDFLGSLTALGISRQSIGDILIQSGRAVVFLNREVAKFVLSQIDKVGKTGVKVSLGYAEPLPSSGEKKELSGTVASLRLDCVVSELCSVSRSSAARLIEEGLVSVNSLVCEKVVKQIGAGDRISVRKKGKFEILSSDTYSKKGRTVLKYLKYI